MISGAVVVLVVVVVLVDVEGCVVAGAAAGSPDEQPAATRTVAKTHAIDTRMRQPYRSPFRCAHVAMWPAPTRSGHCLEGRRML